MKITLPLPPPENERLIYARNMHRFILSKKYRNYKKEASYELLRMTAMFKVDLKRPTYENQLTIEITAYMPNKKRDPHGILKPLLDVMEGYIYDNDKWVVPIFNETKIDKVNPRVEVEV